MTDEDPFTSFRVAFEKQRNEIQHLYNRMSELEKVNSEVLSYVRQKGTLPELHCSCKSIGVTGAGSHGSETDLRQSSLCSFSPEPFAVNPYTIDDHMEGGEVTENSQALSAPLLSNLIAKHTVELNEVLETLGLESSQRTQLLKQIQSNMSSILFSQIKREPVAKVNGELTVSSSQQNPDFKVSQSLRSSLQSTSSNPLRETFASEDQADQLSSASNDDPQVTSSFTDVHQKRRQELQRINQKMYSSATVVGSPQAVAVPNYSIALNRQPDTCWSSPFVRTQSVRMDSSLGKRALCQAESDHASTHLFAGLSREIPKRQPNSVTSQLDTYLEALCKKSQQKSQLRSPNSVVEKPCPCGNRNTCPLTLIKQRRFANDPRVQRGFIRIAALFRGRLVRRLLTTNKVYDLIRTVKDTAKLALSIHIERQESNKQPLCNPDTPDADPSDALSSQELILESRLLNQLRGSLSQLHEIFFVWPISARIELLHVTRSAPPRKKNPTIAHRLHDESTRSSGPASENSRSSWTHSTIPEYRHHSEGNVVQPVQRQTKPKNCSENRVLRLLQPQQANRLRTSDATTDPSKWEKEDLPISSLGARGASVRYCGNSTPVRKPLSEKSDRQKSRRGQEAKQTAAQPNAPQRPQSARVGSIYPGKVVHTPATSRAGIFDRAHPSIKNGPSCTAGPATAGRSCIVLQSSSDVGQTEKRKNEAVSVRAEQHCSPHARKSQSATPDSFTTSRSASLQTSGKCGTDDGIRHVEDEAADCARSPILSTVPSMLSERRTEIPISVVHRSELSGVPPHQTQTAFSVNSNTSRRSELGNRSSTRALLERGIEAMAKSNIRNEVGSVFPTNAQCVYRGRRPGSESVDQTRPVHTVCPGTTPSGDWYPVRRRIVSNQGTLSNTSTKSSGSEYKVYTTVSTEQSESGNMIVTKSDDVDSSLSPNENFTVNDHSENPHFVSSTVKESTDERTRDIEQKIHSAPNPQLRATWSLDSSNSPIGHPG